MRTAISALHCLALLGLAAPTHAATPSLLEPSSKWVLDFANDTCRLIRVFGSGSSEVKAVFDQIAPRSATSLTLIGPGVRASSGTGGHVLALEPNGWRMIDGTVWMAEGSGTKAIVWPDIEIMPPDKELLAEVNKKLEDAWRPHRQAPRERPKRKTGAEIASTAAQNSDHAKRIQSLRVDPGLSNSFAIHTGPMDAAFDALEQCAHDSLVEWGVDPAVYDKIVRPAWSQNVSIGPADYPYKALRLGLEADIKARLNVDADGKITGCKVTTNVNAPDFGTHVCGALQRRARFEPAELADGTKVPDYVVVPVSFRMSNDIQY